MVEMDINTTRFFVAELAYTHSRLYLKWNRYIWSYYKKIVTSEIYLKFLAKVREKRFYCDPIKNRPNVDANRATNVRLNYTHGHVQHRFLARVSRAVYLFQKTRVRKTEFSSTNSFAWISSVKKYSIFTRISIELRKSSL